MLTRAECDALFEAMKGILGVRRAAEVWIDRFSGLVDSTFTDEEIADRAKDLEAMLDVPPVARPRSVEPDLVGPPTGVHPGPEGE